MYNSIEQLLSERNLVKLQASSFTKQMLSNYDESSIHILIYAVQNQHSLPSKSSIAKAKRRQERKQLRKSGGQLKRLQTLRFQRTNQRPMIRPRSFLLPNNNIQPKVTPMLGNLSITNWRLLPGLSPMPSTHNLPLTPCLGMPPMPSTPNLPLYIQLNPLLYNSFPPQIHPMPFKRGKAKRNKVNKIQIDKNHPFSQRFTYSLSSRPHKQGQIRRMSPELNEQNKEKINKYKVLSPEQIIIKALRKKCENELKKQLQQVKKEKSLSQTIEKKQVPLYFQKKKESQKRRRLQKHELIKKNRQALLKIFGTRIFKKGWFISRKDILEALNCNLPQSRQQQNIEGIGDLFATDSVDEKIELEKEEALDSIAQIFMLQETSPEVCVSPCLSG